MGRWVDNDHSGKSLAMLRPFDVLARSLTYGCLIRERS